KPKSTPTAASGSGTGKTPFRQSSDPAPGQQTNRFPGDGRASPAFARPGNRRKEPIFRAAVSVSFEESPPEEDTLGGEDFDGRRGRHPDLPGRRPGSVSVPRRALPARGAGTRPRPGRQPGGRPRRRAGGIRRCVPGLGDAGSATPVLPLAVRAV